ncbi:hypothetical protein Poly30_29020 [Planctomycetes bacterium Poly30]|uniref:Uncharacterized protein n=1 Tax=Saltatorellus ferox TaxID=2528018 RepID=A0A518ETH0_9BACT|nr:hypothetical protein Poly30_29020 [Planctomycetes bacterium Poly30]
MTTDFHSPVGPDDIDSDLTPEQLREADALEALLARSAGPRGDQALGDDGELARIVGRVRSGCSTTSAADELQARRVAQRVLARTTREDISRRADVGVILGFAADRLRDSALLRVAAALLIVQLTLVPLVAWQVWKAPHSGVFQTGIEPSAAELAKALEDLPADDLVNDLGLDEAGNGVVDSLDRALDRMALEESLLEANAFLALRASAIPDDLEPTSRIGEALRVLTRLAVLDARTSDRENPSSLALRAEWLGGLREAPTGFGAIVAAEARLDHLVAGGGWEGLPEALERVVEAGLKSLAGRTMRRAQLLGVALPSEGQSLIEETNQVWVRSSDAWLRALGDAARTAEPGDPYVQAWCRAIVQDS